MFRKYNKLLSILRIRLGVFVWINVSKYKNMHTQAWFHLKIFFSLPKWY